MGRTEARARVHTASVKEVICFPGFVFHPPNGLQTLLANKEFKNCSPSCVPKCSEGCGELERWQLAFPALPLQQEATSPLAATTHLYNMPERKETRSNCKAHCTPHQELLTHLPWEWETCARHEHVP